MSGDEDYDYDDQEGEEEDNIDVSFDVGVTINDDDNDDDYGGRRRGGGNNDDDDDDGQDDGEDNDDDDEDQDDDDDGSSDDDDNPQPQCPGVNQRSQLRRPPARGGRRGRGPATVMPRQDPRYSNNSLLGDSSSSSDDSHAPFKQTGPRQSQTEPNHRRRPINAPPSKVITGRGVNTSSDSSDSTNIRRRRTPVNERVARPKKVEQTIKPVARDNAKNHKIQSSNLRQTLDSSSYARSGADVVHQYAQIYFEKVLTPDMQKRAKRQIRKMDCNGDGKVVLDELLRAISSESTRKSIRKLFKFLDVDNNGFLNFEECITVFYLQQVGYSVCKLCRDPIFNSGYSCRICWDTGAINGRTYDVCIACYTGMRPSQHPHQDFVDMHILHSQTSKIAAAATSMVQCISCGDFHNKNISSYLVQGEEMHVNKDFVCEWCRAWPCTNCGKYIQAPASAAKPKMFLNASYYCRDCKKPGSLLDMNPIIRGILNNTQLQNDCPTCAIKIRTGDLFAIPTQCSAVEALVVKERRPINNTHRRNPGGSQPNTLATVSQIINNVANVASIGNNLISPLMGGTDGDCGVQ